MINETQRKLIEKKYGNLIHKISGAINGDEAVGNTEDNNQDLWMTVLEAIDAFSRQHSGKNGTFEDFWGSSGFDKYIKTCLWTKKNNKGSKITKKAKVNGSLLELDSNIAKNLKQKSPDVDISFITELIKSFSNKEKEIISYIQDDPDAIKGSGKINILHVSKALGITWKDCDRLISNIGDKIKNEL